MNFRASVEYHQKKEANADIYGGKDPNEIPIYTASDVGRFVNIPVSTIRAWAFGLGYKTATGSQVFQPVLDLPDKDVNLL